MTGEMIPNGKNAAKRAAKEAVYAETTVHAREGSWLLVSPLTVRAAQHWGRGTRWCTAFTDTDAAERYWRHYSDGPLYVLLTPDAKFQASPRHGVACASDDSTVPHEGLAEAAPEPVREAWARLVVAAWQPCRPCQTAHLTEAMLAQLQQVLAENARHIQAFRPGRLIVSRQNLAAAQRMAMEAQRPDWAFGGMDFMPDRALAVVRAIAQEVDPGLGEIKVFLEPHTYAQVLHEEGVGRICNLPNMAQDAAGFRGYVRGHLERHARDPETIRKREEKLRREHPTQTMMSTAMRLMGVRG